MPEGRSAGLVLAAGSSRRMGRPKQTLDVAGRPLLELVVEQACASALDEVIVVLGAAEEQVRAAVDMGRARVVVNPDHATGMASSLRAGLAAVAAGVDRIVVVLGDQVEVTATLLDELLALHARSGRPAAAVSAGGLLQPPAVLDSRLWDDLRSLAGDVGLRGVLRARAELVAGLPLAGPSTLIDLDTPDDYARLMRRRRWRGS